MKILFVGAGASGVAGAIIYKRTHPSDDVLIIEHLDKPLKKILATGNGKCNLTNEKLDINKYSNSEFVKEVFEDYSFDNLIKFFESLGIVTKSVDGLIYPITESAETVRNAFLGELRKLHVKLNIQESLLDYEVQNDEIKVKTSKAEYLVDKLVISAGGKAAPQLGSDGSIYKILEKHGYEFDQINAGLSPIYTEENTSILSGQRVKANVKVFKGDELVFEEPGEVLFKEKGLSGIVIFNASRVIAKEPKSGYKIYLDLLQNYSKEVLQNYCKTHTNSEFLRGFLSPKMISYFEKNRYNNGKEIEFAKSLPFTYKNSYDFEFAQVTVGGVKPEALTPNLESKKEKGVYFIGEIVDVDGPCGGYNLTWAFVSSSRIK